VAAPVHDTLDKFELVDFALSQTVAVIEFYGVENSLVITFHTIDKTTDLAYFQTFCSLHGRHNRIKSCMGKCRGLEKAE
jgi:hypothetical protein